jgi:hypothetical protein
MEKKERLSVSDDVEENTHIAICRIDQVLPDNNLAGFTIGMQVPANMLKLFFGCFEDPRIISRQLSWSQADLEVPSMGTDRL